MRKRRVIIFDDEKIIRNMLEVFFHGRNYEALTYKDPAVCPVYGNTGNQCPNEYPCADIIITDYKMPVMDGLTLLRYQQQNGCKLDIRNKALMSGYIDDENVSLKIEELGCAFFYKPFSLSSLADWIDECEERIGLSQRVGIIRKEPRFNTNISVAYATDSKDDIFDGLVTNHSESGLCIATNYRLTKDQKIRINTELPNSCREALVRWAKVTEENCYVAGLSVA